MSVYHAAGRTNYIDIGFSCIPLYHLNDREVILFDCGYGGEERETLLRILNENNLHVAAIVLTHAHVDHISNARFLKEKYGCPLALPLIEAGICLTPLAVKVMYDTTPMSVIDTPYFNSIHCDADIFIAPDQTELTLCGETFSVVQTPGHSAGHVCYITPDNVACLGDALLSSDLVATAKLPFAFSAREDIKSKQALASLSCPRYILSHKGICEDILPLIRENIDCINDRADKVAALIDRPMSWDDITAACAEAFHIFIEEPVRYYEVSRMVLTYIQYLEDTGRLTMAFHDNRAFYVKQ
jgi:glyoxylase-like metal-dependent hydrolase (beta-lactamase superfamily II)